MPTEAPESVTRWIGDVKADGDDAAHHRCEFYFDRLVHLARNKLRTSHRRAAVEDEDGLDGRALDRLVGSDPMPEFAALVAERYRRLRDALGDDSLRQVLDLRLEGFGREEIAARLGCAVRTVTRKLNVIRQTWLENES